MSSLSHEARNRSLSPDSKFKDPARELEWRNSAIREIRQRKADEKTKRIEEKRSFSEKQKRKQELQRQIREAEAKKQVLKRRRAEMKRKQKEADVKYGRSYDGSVVVSSRGSPINANNISVSKVSSLGGDSMLSSGIPGIKGSQSVPQLAEGGSPNFDEEWSPSASYLSPEESFKLKRDREFARNKALSSRPGWKNILDDHESFAKVIPGEEEIVL